MRPQIMIIPLCIICVRQKKSRGLYHKGLCFRLSVMNMVFVIHDPDAAVSFFAF